MIISVLNVVALIRKSEALQPAVEARLASVLIAAQHAEATPFPISRKARSPIAFVPGHLLACLTFLTIEAT